MKQRLDLLLVERGLAETRTKAQALIMAGQVTLQGSTLQSAKAGMLVDEGTQIVIREGLKYVSRGGLKLESVSTKLGLDFNGKVVLDVGSSTGGFTDYALQNGATKVFSVDVGRGQLAQKLRNDERVVSMEQTDIRDAVLSELADIAVIDVSFISLTKVLETVRALIKQDGHIIVMAKPQFEASKQIADRYKGVIKDQKVRQEILESLEQWIKEHFLVVAAEDSGLSGAEGNIERFYLLTPRH